MNALNVPFLFIAGIDTDIGKTIATAALARQIADSGRTVITQKLVQTGSRRPAEDIVTHRRLQGWDLLPEDHDGTTCRYVFDYPCSPHLAAKKTKQVIDIEKITQDTHTLKQRYDTVLIEGAGGLLVPITDSLTIADYVADCGYPLVLVTSGRLGSINHTTMSLEICRLRAIAVAAVVYNQYPPTDALIADETYHYLQGYLKHHHPDTLLTQLPEMPL